MPGNNQLLAQARALYQQGRLDESEAVFHELLASNGFAAEAASGVGMIRLRRGDVAESAKLFRTALEHDADNADAHYGLGVVAQRQNALAEALSHFRLAVMSNPRHTGAIKELAQVTSELERLRSPQPEPPRASATAHSGPTPYHEPPQAALEQSGLAPSTIGEKTAAAGFYAMLRSDTSPIAKQAVELIEKLNGTYRLRLRAHLGMIVGFFVAWFIYISTFEKLRNPVYALGGQTLMGIWQTVFAFAFFASIPYCIWLCVHVKSTEVTFSQGRVEIRAGVFGRKVKNIELYRITDVSLQQTLMNRLTGDGSVDLSVEQQGRKHVVVRLRGLQKIEELNETYERLRNLVLILRSGNWGKGIIY